MGSGVGGEQSATQPLSRLQLAKSVLAGKEPELDPEVEPPELEPDPDPELPEEDPEPDPLDEPPSLAREFDCAVLPHAPERPTQGEPAPATRITRFMKANLPRDELGPNCIQRHPAAVSRPLVLLAE